MHERGPPYGAALRSTLRATAAAYGYTLTTGATLAALVSTHGAPRTGEAMLFAAGGVLAFAVLEAVTLILHPGDEPAPRPGFRFTGALNFAAVFVALGAASGLAHGVDGSIAWLLAPMASTALYMLGVAAQLHVADRLGGRARARRMEKG
jgi:hypothetical protein